jgi:hypothetical protein
MSRVQYGRSSKHTPQAWLRHNTYYSESPSLICLGEKGFDILQPRYFETPPPSQGNQQGINVWQPLIIFWLPILEMFEGECLIFRSYNVLNPLLLKMQINRGSISHNHNEMTKITISNQSHKSYRKYKSENGHTRTSEYIRGEIRCHGGVSIPCWPVTPAVSPISTFDERHDPCYIVAFPPSHLSPRKNGYIVAFPPGKMAI